MILESKLRETGSKTNVHVLLAALKACSRTRNLESGMQVHAEAVKCGHDCNIYMANALINMYAKCGSIADAREVFDSMKHPTVVSWTALILGYTENGQGHTALDLFSRMRTDGPSPNSVTVVAALKACTSLAVKEASGREEYKNRGKEIHSFAVQNGSNTDDYVQSTLIDMYAKCGSMIDAREVFDGVKFPDVVSWTVLISGYADNGQGYTALEMFHRMRTEGFAPNSVTLVAALKACTSLALKEEDNPDFRNTGKDIHSYAILNGCISDVYVQNTLIDMYAKCGSMGDAHEVFDGMKQPTVVSWTALILGYTDNRQSKIAVDMFIRMRNEGPTPNPVTLVAVLKACSSLTVKGACPLVDTAKAIHNIAVESESISDVYVQNALVDMYAKCGAMIDAHEVFDYMKHPDVVSWNALILGYAANGKSATALGLFTRMRTEGPAPDSVTLVASIKACSSFAVEGGASRWAECKDTGQQLHSFAVRNGCSSDVYVQSTLLDMYAKCGSMVDAHEVFDGMKYQDVVSWTTLILGYADNGQGRTALDMFTRMEIEGPAPDSVTLIAALKACSSLAIKEGASKWKDRVKQIHKLAVENDWNADHYFRSTLIDTYAKCGSMADAQEVFDNMEHPDVVSWTALILGYADNGQEHTALDMFTKMGIEGLAPDSVTLVAALKACTSLAMKGGSSHWSECRDRGKEIHNFAVQNGCESDVYVQNTLIDMYAKCSSMVEARKVFDGMKHPTVVSWTALILGYTDNDQGQTALDLFTRMRTEGIAPSSVTFAAVLKACGLIGALEFGRTIHSELSGECLDVVLITCLVDFYAKCGSLMEAQSVFDLHADTRDMITWNALLAGYSTCGDNEIVFGLFQGMQDAGFKPNSTTFLCILMCCSHAGLVVKGKECFDEMSTKYGIIPCVEHYTCMIDLLGRANKVDDAMRLLKAMPCSPDGVTWRSILGSCLKWKNVEIGRLAFQSLIDLDDKDTAAYVLMEQIYWKKMIANMEESFEE